MELQTETGHAARATTVTGSVATRRTALAATALTTATWVVATQVAGIDLVVGAGARTQHVGVASVVVSSVVATYAGLGLLRVLRRRTPHADRTWAVVAALVLLLSLAGPLGAGSLAAGLALGLMHLEVAAVVAVAVVRAAGQRRDRPGRVA